MKHTHEAGPAHAVGMYAALRHGGASQSRAQVELAVTADRARQLEALFKVRRPGKGGDAMRPRFSRDGAHVAAVLAAGGYPAVRR